MKIISSKTIEELKAEFNTSFPGLSLSFVKAKHENNEGSPKSSVLNENLTLKEVSPKLMDGSIILLETKTVRELEEEFEKRFGLHVQVNRRSNDVWLQTTATDDWTLREQNRKGNESLKNY